MITNEQKLNDIIFADRNKAYGAYVLRSEYGHTVFKSLSMMILGVGTIASVALFMNNKNQPEESLAGQIIIQDTIYNIPVTLDEPAEPQAAERHEDPATTTENTDASGAESTTIVDSVRTSVETSTTSVAAVESSVSIPGVGTNSSAAGAGTSTGLHGKPDTNNVAAPYEVDSAPEFEGGYAALTRFVARNLKYPEPAYELGEEGIVYVKFVVDERGKVGRLSLLNTAGYGMDEEALRVIALIPNFKSPAKAKGVAVKSYYQLPIRFRFR